jgi:cytochrome c-type biogenesis protein CcmH/NrfG
MRTMRKQGEGSRAMRKRVLLVLSVAALMVAMVVVAALPAFAAPASGGQPSPSLTATRVFMGALLICAGLLARRVLR